MTPWPFNRTRPILPIVDVEKAKEFYVSWLGCKIDWEHQFEENAPKHIQDPAAQVLGHPFSFSATLSSGAEME